MRNLLIAILCACLLVGCVNVTPSVSSFPPARVSSLSHVRAGIVTLAAGPARGSGFVMAEDESFYYVGTAAHVVGYYSHVLVDGEPSLVMATDHRVDVAVVLVVKDEQRYRTFKRGEARLGQWCRAFGFHWVNNMQPQFMVLVGNVSTLDFCGFVGTNTGLFPGTSGGPLLNAAGEVIGINSRLPRIYGAPHESMSMFAKPDRLYEMLKKAQGV